MDRRYPSPIHWLLLLPFLALTLSCQPTVTPADTVLLNAHVLTVDEHFTTVEAIAIREGRILATGSTTEMEKWIGSTTHVLDAEGATVIPGIIEQHLHSAAAVQREYTTPFAYRQFSSIGEIQQWVQEQTEQVDPSIWIQIPRTDLPHLREGRIPAPDELTEAAPNHPVIFNWQYADMQIQVLNRAALDAAGIDRSTEPPAGGTLETDSAGDPTGILHNSGSLVAPYLSRNEIPEEALLDELERLHTIYLSTGITSIGERAANPEIYRLYDLLNQQERLRVRTVVTLRISPEGDAGQMEEQIRALPIDPTQGDEWLKPGPLKLAVDGGALFGTAWMRDPYNDASRDYYRVHDDPYHGALQSGQTAETLPDWLFQAIHTGHRLGWQMSAHITGDAGVDAVLDAVEASRDELGRDDLRFNLIHAYFVHPDIADRVVRLGVGVDTQPAWHYLAIDELSNVWPREWMNRFIGLRNWLDAGAVVSINTDHMFGFDPDRSLNPFNPFLTLATAVTRETIRGNVYAPDQAVSREEALRMMTIDAAWLSFDEENKGSIEPGKLADLAILSAPYLEVPDDEISSIRARLTMVDGAVLYEDSLNPVRRLQPDSSESRVDD
ncbi:MAG: amidohydrolase [Balneolaceae bacterium]